MGNIGRHYRTERSSTGARYPSNCATESLLELLLHIMCEPVLRSYMQSYKLRQDCDKDVKLIHRGNRMDREESCWRFMVK
jgi:hypothetical protein